MNIDPLIKMANDIAAYFDSEKDRDEAARLVANHLKRYWEPRMRRAIIAHFEKGGGGLGDLARGGVALLAAGKA